MKQVPKFLDQLVGRPGGFAGLANSGEGPLLLLIEPGWITHKEPNSLPGGEVLQRKVGNHRSLNDSHVPTKRDQEMIDLSLRSGVPLVSDLSIDLQAVRTPLLPS